MFFTSPEHKRRWLVAMLAIGKVYDGKLDPEYGAAVYILTSSAGTWERARGYVSSSGIEFEELLSEVDWSGGYSSLLKLAGNLFNDRTACSPVDLPTRLDDRNFAVAMTAFQIRRVNLPLGEQYSDEEIRHARELMETGSTEITDLVRRKLEESEE